MMSVRPPKSDSDEAESLEVEIMLARSVMKKVEHRAATEATKKRKKTAAGDFGRTLKRRKAEEHISPSSTGPAPSSTPAPEELDENQTLALILSIKNDSQNDSYIMDDEDKDEDMVTHMDHVMHCLLELENRLPAMDLESRALFYPFIVELRWAMDSIF
jgi:hypothetical protein